jgi:diguanylate cyclase (GGDEF)-like protein
MKHHALPTAVNDRLGHDAGDDLLVQVSRRVRGVLRGTDVVARQGGDEFVVMVAGITGEAAAAIIGRKMLDAFREPFLVLGHTCNIGLTIGFAIAPQDGTSAGDLLRQADAAMYAGKQGGRNCVRRGVVVAGLAEAL